VAVRIAKSKGFNVFKGEASSLPEEIKKQKYDVVIMPVLLGYIKDSDLLTVMEEAVSILGDEGTLLIFDHCAYKPSARNRGYKPRSLDTLAEYIEKAGLSVTEKRSQKFYRFLGLLLSDIPIISGLISKLSWAKDREETLSDYIFIAATRAEKKEMKEGLKTKGRRDINASL